MKERKSIQLSSQELEKEQPYAYHLMCAPIGDAAKNRLICRLGKPSEVFRVSEKVIQEILGNDKLSYFLVNHDDAVIHRNYEALMKSGISFYPEYHPAFPPKLLYIPSRPFGIFVKGSLPPNKGISLAVVGARDCSEYGRYVAECFGKKLADWGIAIISGMARGIDGIAQKAAIEAGGKSFGVLGCGVDVCYPKSNEGLYRMCMENGGILSTYLPSTPPAPGHFPPRNRIISGLSDAILIIEARNKSGTIITADMALEQGREVFVIPGRITDRLSDGCNSLIRQGASLIQSPGQLLEELKCCVQNRYNEIRLNGFESKSTVSGYKDSAYSLEETISDSAPGMEEYGKLSLQEQVFLKLFDFDLQSIEEIRRKMAQDAFLKDISLPQTMEMLMKFVILGLLKAEGGYYGKSGG